MLWVWTGFLSLILLLLAIDLGVFHRGAHRISVREALAWSAVWIVLSVAFSGVVYALYERGGSLLSTSADPVDGAENDGPSATVKFLTAYALEKSLSIDNIFVMALIFAAFRIPAQYQHRVLFWGILGAIVLRGTMILLGARLVREFEWTLPAFGALLVVSGLRMMRRERPRGERRESFIVRWMRRLVPVTKDLHGPRFLVQSERGQTQNDRGERETAGDTPLLPIPYALTPLALALVTVETSDVLFATDSVPAIFGVTGDPFLIFTSNVFAILGLRSLYFVLAGMLDRIRGLKTALAGILVLVGLKMLAGPWLEGWFGQSFNLALLAAIVLCLIGVIGWSKWRGRRERDAARSV